MDNIKNLLICPVCKKPLTEDLKCSFCNKQYNFSYGVYDIVSQDLSIGYKSLWNVTDEMIKDMFSDKYNEKWRKITQDYYTKLNKETIEGMKKLDERFDLIIKDLSGVACDLATGGGSLLERMLAVKRDDLTIVCTDIDAKELIMTRRRLKTDDSQVLYIATDGRYLSFKDKSFDYVTTYSGLSNIPESDKVVREIYRILKPGGMFIMKDSYIENDSKSFELAKSVGVERGSTEEYLISDLKDAGFKNIESTVIAEAVWAENPYDLIPATGDKQRFCIVKAKRI